MNPYPCRRCVAEAMVEPQGLGWKVQCTAKPMEHQCGPYKSRTAAVKRWNEMQKEVRKE